MMKPCCQKLIEEIEKIVDEKYWNFGFPDVNKNKEFRRFVKEILSQLQPKVKG